MAWLLRRPVSGRLSPCLAAKDSLNEPASAKPYSFPGSEQAETVKDFNFLLFSIIFKVPSSAPMPLRQTKYQPNMQV